MTTTEKQILARKKWNSENKDKIRMYKQKSYAKYRDRILGEKRKPTIKKYNMKLETILQAVSDYYKIKVEDIKSDLRCKDVSQARHVYFYLAKLMTNEILYSIAFEVNRKHCTVVHGYNNISNQMDVYSSLRNDIFEIKQILNPKESIIIQEFNLLDSILNKPFLSA